MANVKITDLAADGSPVDGSAIEVASLSGSTFTSKRMLLSTLASYVVGKFNALLDATPLTIARGGTGGASAQAAARALGVPWTLAQSGTPASVTGTTTETALATIAIPAGAMGPNGFIEIVLLFSWTSSANTKALRARLGGQEAWVVMQTTNVGTKAYLTVNNAGSQTAQRGSPASLNGLGALGSVQPPTIGVNTAAATTLTITGTLTSGTDTLALENYLVRLTYGA